MKNEEYFAPWAIGSIVDFCDEILVVDNYSSDRTWPILNALAGADPRLRLVRAKDVMTTNGLLQAYIGEDIWVFGVDGDEIIDPQGLARLRRRLLAGEFAATWRIKGPMLHAAQVDFEQKRATGFTTPAAKSVVKLFNFALLEEWSADNQRLHGPATLRAGHEQTVADLSDEGGWDGADLRCLHMCFFPRSTADEREAIRHNPTDKKWSRKLHRLWVKALMRAWPWSAAQRASFVWHSLPVKERSYAVGPLSALDIGTFGRPTDFAGLGRLAEDQIEAWSKARIVASDIKPQTGRRAELRRSRPPASK